MKPISYADAGVNIDEADRAVSSIKKLAQATFTRNVLTGIGSFGAMYQLSGFKKPVLISSADGVGTKLKVAQMAGKHDTIGEDLVNHCVNDIMVQGATPLFFLDYFAVGTLDAAVCASVVAGLARGCKANQCALIGGETAEMPGFYAPGEYDVAGFIVGAVERARLITGANICRGRRAAGAAVDGAAYERLFAGAQVDLRNGGVEDRQPVVGVDGGGSAAGSAPQLSEADCRAA